MSVRLTLSSGTIGTVDGYWLEKGMNSVFALVSEEEISFSRIVGPDVLHRFVWFIAVLQFLEIFDDFNRSSGPNCVVDELFLGRWPWCIVQIRSQLHCPNHSLTDS